jgi:hypothetical protein
MFSKRSNFLTRLSEDKRDVLLGRLALLAEVTTTTTIIILLFNKFYELGLTLKM